MKAISKLLQITSQCNRLEYNFDEIKCKLTDHKQINKTDRFFFEKNFKYFRNEKNIHYDAINEFFGNLNFYEYKVRFLAILVNLVKSLFHILKKVVSAQVVNRPVSSIFFS